MKETALPNTESQALLELEIKTARLILHPVSAENIEDIFREFTQEITTYMHPRPPAQLSETEKFVSTSRKNMQKGKEVVCSILKKDTGEFLGCAGLHSINTPTPELGIWVKISAHGHGYGKEAMHGLKHWADQHLQYTSIHYPVAKENAASRKIPESLGGAVKREYQDTNLSGATLEMVEYHIPPSKHV